MIVSTTEQASRNGAIRDKLQSLDWSFTGHRSSTGLYYIDEVNSIHWYPGRCVPALPLTLLSVLSGPGQVLLDPFVGSGTVAVAALQHGLTTIGMDINPLACLISKAKISLITPEELRALAESLTSSILDVAEATRNNADAVTPAIPNLRENSRWYHTRTLAQLGMIKQCIDSIENPKHRTIAFVCFSSILRACCSQQNHWGYICDNVLPRVHIEKDALSTYIKRLQQYVSVFESFYLHTKSCRTREELRTISRASKIVNADAASVAEHVDDSSVDIVVTSPPYAGAIDYVDAQRLTLLWFSDGQELHESARKKEVGARWKRFRKNSTQEFLSELSEILGSLYRTLKAEGFLCLIYGESKKRPPTMDALVSAAKSCGFDHLIGIDRDISMRRTLIPNIMNETIHVFQKL